MALKKLTRLVLWTFLAASCAGEALFPGEGRMSREEGRRISPTLASEDTLSEGPHVYVSGIRFAKGYDWETDTLPQLRYAEAVLFRDGREIRSVPVEDIHPDGHRVLDGHLYTFHQEEDSTRVKRDGEPLLALPEGERVLGIALLEKGICTLGTARGGDGVVFRRNGKLAYSDPEGILLGDPDEGTRESGMLTVDDGAPWFTYSLRVMSGGSMLREYRILRGEETVTVLSAGKVSELLDITVLDGVVFRVEKGSEDPSSTRLVTGGVSYLLGLTDQEQPHQCRIIPWEGGVAVKGYIRYPDGRFRHFVKDLEGDVRVFDQGERLFDVVEEDGFCAYLMSEEGDYVSQAVSEAGPVPDLSEGTYRALSRRCVRLRDGQLLMALTGAEGTPNAVFVDDQRTDLPFNGYLTSVSVFP